jgi:conjugative transposon TraN protein
VRYVDLGSPNLIAGKADGAENVIRVKATVKNFREETNMSVITESGSFYTFNVKYAEEPLLLNIEMKDFIHDGSEVNRPNNALDIYLKELGSESPKLVYLISKSVHKDNKRHIKHIGSKAFGIQYLLRGLYTHNGLLYFHTQIRNRSNVPYEVDFVTFKIVDKKVMKRTAIQEQVIFPLRAYDYVTTVAGKNASDVVAYYKEVETILSEGKMEAAKIREAALNEAKEKAAKKVEQKKSDLEAQSVAFFKALESEKDEFKNGLLAQMPLFKESVAAKLSHI